MKKYLVIFTVILCLSIGMSTSMYAAEIIDSGYCGGEADGTNLTWKLTTDNVLIISGEGPMNETYDNAHSSDIPWYEYRQEIKSIVINEGVTTIGRYAFGSCEATSVDLPSTLTTIRTQAFGDSLRSVVIPASVTEIDTYAFECSDLSVITFEGHAPEITYDILYGAQAIVYYPSNDPTWTDSVMKDCDGSIAWIESGSSWTDISGYYGAEGDGGNITWTLTEDGQLTISGAGAMDEPKYMGYAPWAKYRSIIKSVCIEDGITNIGKCAFRSCYGITSVEIPDSVSVIGLSAFSGCEVLQSVSLPKSVNEIHSAAFEGCESLTEITIPYGVTELSSFSNCKKLEHIDIPDSVTVIGDNAFYGCENLERISIPSNVTSIGYYAFSGCESLKTITIPDGVKKLEGTFNGCINLKEISIPDSVEEIGQLTFMNCDSLISVTIPNSVKWLDAAAFSFCDNLEYVALSNAVPEIMFEAFSMCPKLKAITIPASVTTIYDNTFYGNTSLSTIRFEGNAPQFLDAPTNVFTDVAANVYYPANNATWTADVMQGYGGELTWIPYTPCEIHEWNVDSCLQARSCTVCGYTEDRKEAHSFTCYVSNNNASCQKNGTETAQCLNCEATDTIEDVGSKLPHAWTDETSSTVKKCKLCGKAFQYKVVESGTFESGVMWSFSDDGTLIISGSGVMETFAQPEDTPWIRQNIVNVVVKEGVSTISDYAFWNGTSLQKVYLPNSLIKIGKSAFEHCNYLTEVTIPKNVALIGNAAFANCRRMTSITVDEANTDYCSWSNMLLTKDMDMLCQCPAGMRGEVIIPNTVETIADSAFSWCENLTGTLTIADSVKKIGNYAFFNCSGFDSLELSKDLLSIGDDAFYACTGFKGQLTLPSRLEAIGDRAFCLCTGLSENLIIPTGVTSIGEGAFCYCYSLTGTSIPSSVELIGRQAFAFCADMKFINVNQENTTYSSVEGILYDKAQQRLIQCPGKMESVRNIPMTVKTIGETSFAGCYGLREILIPTSVICVEEAAFFTCTSIETVLYNSTENMWNNIQIAEYNTPLVYTEQENNPSVILEWSGGHKVLAISGDADDSTYVIVAVYENSGKLILANIYTTAEVKAGAAITSSTEDFTQCYAIAMFVDGNYSPISNAVCTK